MAFLLEATFVGLFFFGWDRLSKLGHLIVTWLVALGTNLSALWILIANGWMQNPVGAVFNPDTMRMEMTDFAAVLFNPVAQAKFVHTVSAGYTAGAMYVMAISAWYLLRKRHIDLAKRSMVVAASFGLAASLSVVVLGDESGYLTTEHQKMKIAAIESMWQTEPPPANFNLIAVPDQAERKNDFALEIPLRDGSQVRAYRAGYTVRCRRRRPCKRHQSSGRSMVVAASCGRPPLNARRWATQRHLTADLEVNTLGHIDGPIPDDSLTPPAGTPFGPA